MRPDPGGTPGMSLIEIVAPVASEAVDFEPEHRQRRERDEPQALRCAAAHVQRKISLTPL